MNKLWVVTKNELLRFFISPLAYVYLVAFLLLNGSFAVYFGHFIGLAIADLSSMFIFQPWLYLLFIPGISMRLWSEEFKTKTIVQIMTMPVSMSPLVWGKFFASWLFTAIALILTFPFWITVNYLGSPDNSVIILSYFGSWVLAGCMLAISQTMSALTKNQVIALVLSVIVNFLFFLSGVEYVLGFFRMFAPVFIVDMVASFSFLTHFATIVKGLLELRDIVFFTSIVVLFNVTTILIISFKTSGTSSWLKSTQAGYYVLVFILMLFAFTGINLFANGFFRSQQYDFTEEKIYTLSSASKKVLKDIDEPITARFYYSPILGQRNPGIRLMFERVSLLLQRFEKETDGKFTYRIYNPRPLDDVEDQAIAHGLQPIPLIDLNQNGFFGLVMTDSIDRRQVMPFFSVERTAFMEQDLIEKIYQIYHKKKILGVISSLPIFDTKHSSGYFTQQWNIVTEIKKFYDVKSIEYADDLSQIDVLMLLHPQRLPEDLVEGIKKYSTYGGKTLLLLDTAAEAPRIFSPINTEYYPSHLNGLDDFWGFRFYNELVITDLDNSILVDATKDYSTNPTFTQDIIQFVIPQSGMNPDFMITERLKGILFASATVVAPNGNNSLFLPLIVAGENSGLMTSGVVYEGKNPRDLLRAFKPSKQTKFVSALLVGKNEPSPFEVIVVGDTDFIYDTFWSVGKTVLENNYYLPLYDNANFVMNSLDYLSRDKVLIPLRGKSQKVRNFEDLENMRKQNLHDFRIKESEIFDRINITKTALNEVYEKKTFEEREEFNPDELAVIANTRKMLDGLRVELGIIRTEMHKSLEKASLIIKLINIYSVPGLIILGLLIISIKKSSGRVKEKSSLEINKEFKVVGLVSTALLIIGGVSVYFLGINDISRYEDKVVFEDFGDKLNDIDTITLTSNKGKLEFYKEVGIWKLRGRECLVVYQERINRFLSTIVDATYYEKKSDKVEYLSKFGLEPIEKETSPNIRIDIRGKDNKKILGFNVGKYDIDVGRGGRAAYIKFDNQFEVWMVKADLVDLSVSAKDWTYNNLWNLRFGRLSGFNDTKNLNRTLELIKELLNSGFVDEAKGLSDTQNLSNLYLSVEDSSNVIIDFVSKDGDIWVKYSYKDVSEKTHMKFFAEQTEGCYFKISKNSYKRIDDVIATVR